MREGDLPALVSMMTDPQQVRFVEFEPTEASAKALLDWSLRTAQEDPRTTYSFAITLRNQDDAIGTCSMAVRDPANRTGNLGILLDRRYHHRGIALEAGQAGIQFGFETLGLHRLTAGCAARNLASARLMERLGMRREAHFRESHWQKDAWHDWYLYALLASEWRTRNHHTP
jgi:RimJ/RimL family protein N-acetyltransferase